jgi:NADPH-dependent 2,4-dienoyl-CoA reductase/sulfur reductase-like enzyme
MARVAVLGGGFGGVAAALELRRRLAPQDEVLRIELGDGKAIPAEGEFFATPHPRFTFGPASPDGLRDKQRFEADRLAAWFGPE